MITLNVLIIAILCKIIPEIVRAGALLACQFRCGVDFGLIGLLVYLEFAVFLYGSAELVVSLP